MKLRAAVEAHLPKALEFKYDDPDEAAGMCLEATDQFLHTLNAYGLLGDGTGHGFIREYIFTPQDAKEAFVQRMDDFLEDFPFDPDGTNFHFVAKVDEYIIDWTARQFDPQAPLPAIWREV